MAELKPFGYTFMPKTKDRITITLESKPIVFCWDCEEYQHWDGDKICMRLGSYYGNMRPDDYCSYGMKRQEEY